MSRLLPSVNDVDCRCWSVGTSAAVPLSSGFFPQRVRHILFPGIALTFARAHHTNRISSFRAISTVKFHFAAFYVVRNTAPFPLFSADNLRKLRKPRELVHCYALALADRVRYRSSTCAETIRNVAPYAGPNTTQIKIS